jgi:AcrR family transcriptional regulator
MEDMTRIPASERVLAIVAAATDAFARLGYRGTRTADVAAGAGISAGSLFTYVESKEALFHLVLLHWLGLLPDPPAVLPLATPAPGETLALLQRELPEFPEPRLRAALAGDEPVDVAGELRGIVEERYDLIERYSPLFAIVERCAADLPELETVWFSGARAGYYAELADYLDRRTAAGRLRPMPDSVVTARLVTETVTWSAWRRRGRRDAALYDDHTARRTVIEFVCAALLPLSEPGAAAASSRPHAARVKAAGRASPSGDKPDSALKEHE